MPNEMIPCYCDNSGIVTNLMSMKKGGVCHPNDTMNDYHDIYAAITATATRCHPLWITYIHVKGHQDQRKDHPLTTEEAHNVECDSAAKSFVQKSTLQSTTLSHLEFKAAQPHLLIDGKIICRRVIPAL